MYEPLGHSLNVPYDAIDHRSSFYLSNKLWLKSFWNFYLYNNIRYIWSIIYNNINISNRFNLQTEYLSIATSKFMVESENQFSRVKCDVKKLFNWRILRNRNSFNNFFPKHTIVYVPGPYQRQILPILCFQHVNYCHHFKVKSPETRSIANVQMWDPNIYVMKLPTINNVTMNIICQSYALPVTEKRVFVICKSGKQTLLQKKYSI